MEIWNNTHKAWYFLRCQYVPGHYRRRDDTTLLCEVRAVAGFPTPVGKSIPQDLCCCRVFDKAPKYRFWLVCNITCFHIPKASVWLFTLPFLFLSCKDLLCPALPTWEVVVCSPGNIWTRENWQCAESSPEISPQPWSDFISLVWTDFKVTATVGANVWKEKKSHVPVGCRQEPKQVNLLYSFLFNNKFTEHFEFSITDVNILLTLILIYIL